MRLTPDADRLWTRLRNGPVPAVFVLIGGPALVLHLRHRINEDLQVEELFQTKALVTASRSKPRDWFDLYYLRTERGYTMEDFVRTFERMNCSAKLDIALHRLCSDQPSIADEGFSTLAGHAPSLAEMTDYFPRERDRVEIERARRARLLEPAEQRS